MGWGGDSERDRSTPLDKTPQKVSFENHFSPTWLIYDILWRASEKCADILHGGSQESRARS